MKLFNNILKILATLVYSLYIGTFLFIVTFVNSIVITDFDFDVIIPIIFWIVAIVSIYVLYLFCKNVFWQNKNKRKIYVCLIVIVILIVLNYILMGTSYYDIVIYTLKGFILPILPLLISLELNEYTTKR